MAYQINGVNIPATIYGSGTYTPPDGEVLRTNGQGDLIEGRVKIVRWKWAILSKSDYEWWTQTILSNGKSLRCAVRLPNETWVETAYATAIVKKPTTDGVSVGSYQNVEIEIELMP